MLGIAGWQKKTRERLFRAFVILSTVSALLLSAWGCAEFHPYPYNSDCRSGEYWSSTAQQCVRVPGA